MMIYVVNFDAATLSQLSQLAGREKTLVARRRRLATEQTASARAGIPAGATYAL